MTVYRAWSYNNNVLSIYILFFKPLSINIIHYIRYIHCTVRQKRVRHTVIARWKLAAIFPYVIFPCALFLFSSPQRRIVAPCPKCGGCRGLLVGHGPAESINLSSPGGETSRANINRARPRQKA